MKAERKRRGFLPRIGSVLTHNWGLKLLSLILAIIVYHSLKTENGTVQDTHDRNIFQQH